MDRNSMDNLLRVLREDAAQQHTCDTQAAWHERCIFRRTHGRCTDFAYCYGLCVRHAKAPLINGTEKCVYRNTRRNRQWRCPNAAVGGERFCENHATTTIARAERHILCESEAFKLDLLRMRPWSIFPQTLFYEKLPHNIRGK